MEQAPCEICGKMITTAPHPRKTHVDACRAKHNIANEETKKAGEEIKDPELKKLHDQALVAAERRRKQAPDILAKPAMTKDAFASTTEMLIKSGKVPEGMHVYWGDVNTRGVDANNGYIPIITEGEHVRVGENVAYMIPQEIVDAEKKAAAMESKRRLRERALVDNQSIEGTPIHDVKLTAETKTAE